MIRPNPGSLRMIVLVAVVMVSGCVRALGIGACRAATPAAVGQGGDADLEEAPDYDPWQAFNEPVFDFNYDVFDRWLIKPAAEGWAFLLPAPARRGIGRVLDNLDMPRRFANKLLQGRPLDVGRELARFTINATVGLAGLIDVAAELRLQASDADAGQTLGTYGIGTGPYLVLPAFPPLTVRDGVGRGLDSLLNPVGYFLPFFIYPAHTVATTVNDRSLNLELFANVEEGTLDLYSAARNGYLQRRRRVVGRAVAERERQWRWLREACRPRTEPGSPGVTSGSENQE